MKAFFTIRGIVPGIGRIVEQNVFAHDAREAKIKAEASGLRWVVVRALNTDDASHEPIDCCDLTQRPGVPGPRTGRDE